MENQVELKVKTREQVNNEWGNIFEKILYFICTCGEKLHTPSDIIPTPVISKFSTRKTQR